VLFHSAQKAEARPFLLRRQVRFGQVHRGSAPRAPKGSDPIDRLLGCGIGGHKWFWVSGRGGTENTPKPTSGFA
jgi:hypothetical protein